MRPCPKQQNDVCEVCRTDDYVTQRERGNGDCHQWTSTFRFSALHDWGREGGRFKSFLHHHMAPTYPSPSRSMIAASCCVRFLGHLGFHSRTAISKQRRLFSCRRDLEILIRQLSGHAAARSPVQKSYLH